MIHAITKLKITILAQHYAPEEVSGAVLATELAENELRIEKKINIVSSVFPPEPITSAKTSFDIALELSRRGYAVSAITSFPSRPAGKMYPNFSRRLYKKEKSSYGFEIVRCFSIFSKHSSLISRLLENLSFGITSGLWLLFSSRADVIYANTWPIFAVGIIRWVASIKRIPLIISIQDVYPESLISQGRMKKNNLVNKILLSLDKWIARGCQSIIMISEHFARIYSEARNINHDKINVIPNWVDKNSVHPSDKKTYRDEKNIPEDAFVLIYGGNVGIAAGVESVLHALRKIQSNLNLYLVIAGSGSQLQICQKMAEKIKTCKVVFQTPWEVDDTSKVLAAADVLLLPTKGEQSLFSVPSKLITYMLSARPVLTIALPESDIAKVVIDAGCGWIVPPNNPDIFAEYVDKISHLSQQKLMEMGAAGRKYAMKNFTTEVCLPKAIAIIKSVIENQ